MTGLITVKPLAKNPKLYLQISKKPLKSKTFIGFLKHLRHHLRGKMILVIDRLSVHRAKETTRFLKTQEKWLTVKWFPSYAPELNPVEYLWSAAKRKTLANFSPDTIEELEFQFKRGIRRIKRRPDILTGFLKASGLFKKELSR